jgi:trimeric autotransporter adhesin
MDRVRQCTASFSTRVLTDFDIVAAAGAPKKAVVRQFTATANTSGQIAIQYLTGSANNPQSSGVEVIR